MRGLFVSLLSATLILGFSPDLQAQARGKAPRKAPVKASVRSGKAPAKGPGKAPAGKDKDKAASKPEEKQDRQDGDSPEVKALREAEQGDQSTTPG